jgi:hypothetical protein
MDAAVSILSYDDKDLNLSNIALSMPSSVQGGSYFTRIHYAKRPLYMQSPKCISKQGITAVGKKMYIELIISNEKDGEFISFLENLEKTCIDMIFEKRHMWLTDELEKTDIETAFASIIKSYKNGTSHLLKLNINNTSNHAKHGIGIGGLQTCFVFDENNNSLKFDDVKPEMSFITLIEFEGIKFTSKSFQFEMNARQILVIDEKPIFNSCLIKPKKKDDPESNEKVNEDRDRDTNDDTSNTTGQPEECVLASDVSSSDVVGLGTGLGTGLYKNNIGNDYTTHGNGGDTNDESVPTAAAAAATVATVAAAATVATTTIELIKENEMTRENESAKNNVESLGELKEETTQNEKVNENETVEMYQHEGELVEVNLDIPQELDSSGFEKIKLQNANDVYYKMYKEAKEKAKSAKKIAVEAYLAAEEIKFTYNLIDNESDSDNSSESESESDSDSDNNNGK